MERLIKRINGLIRIAEKRQKRSELDKAIGLAMERGLRIVKQIIFEEITPCEACKYKAEFPQAIDEGFITFLEANKMYCEGAECLCCLFGIGTGHDDYCSRGEKAERRTK